MSSSTPHKLLHLRDAAPKLAAELERLLAAAGESMLASRMPHLLIHARCDHRHGVDFYTAPRLDRPWGPGHRTLGLLPGGLHVDAVQTEIVLVEVLLPRLLYAE